MQGRNLVLGEATRWPGTCCKSGLHAVEPAGSEEKGRHRAWVRIECDGTYVFGHGLVHGSPPDLVLCLRLLDDPLVQG